MASYIKTIARQVLRIKSWIYESARNLYRGRRAVPLQTFTTGHSNRKLSTVTFFSTTFTQCAPETTKFGKIVPLFWLISWLKTSQLSTVESDNSILYSKVVQRSIIMTTVAKTTMIHTLATQVYIPFRGGKLHLWTVHIFVTCFIHIVM